MSYRKNNTQNPQCNLKTTTDGYVRFTKKKEIGEGTTETEMGYKQNTKLATQIIFQPKNKNEKKKENLQRKQKERNKINRKTKLRNTLKTETTFFLLYI